MKFAGYGAGGALAAYFAISIWFHMGQPSPSVDYVAQLNAPIDQIAEDDKAWPIYRPMWLKYDFSEGGNFRIPEIHYEDEEADIYRLAKPGDPNWAAAVAALMFWCDAKATA